MGEKATLCVRMTLSETRGAQKASRVALEIKNTNILDLCFFRYFTVASDRFVSLRFSRHLPSSPLASQSIRFLSNV